MNKKRWHKLKEPHSHYYITDNDYCFYAREYISGTGYAGSSTNSLILNFKKPPLKQEDYEWTLRQQAVTQFKTEIEKLFKSNVTITVTAIPSSKSKTDPKYTHRFEDLFEQLKKSRNINVSIEWPIEIKKTIEASHHKGMREPKYKKENYLWRGFKNNPPKRLYIFDDILTTGSNFRATSDFLRENKYTGKIIGIFWAKTVQRNN